jgi:hypothetical protein
LVPVDDAFDIRVAFACGVLQSAEVSDMTALPKIREPSAAPLPE